MLGHCAGLLHWKIRKVTYPDRGKRVGAERVVLSGMFNPICSRWDRGRRLSHTKFFNNRFGSHSGLRFWIPEDKNFYWYEQGYLKKM